MRRLLWLDTRLSCNVSSPAADPRHLEAILGGAVIEVATHHCLLHLSGRKKRETRVIKKMMHELQYGAYWLDWQLAVW